MARKPATATEGTKPVRKQGPRTLFIVLKPGTDRAAFRASIQDLTFNGRSFLDALGNSDDAEPVPFVKFTITTEKRGGTDSAVVPEAA